MSGWWGKWVVGGRTRALLQDEPEERGGGSGICFAPTPHPRALARWPLRADTFVQSRHSLGAPALREHSALPGLQPLQALLSVHLNSQGDSAGNWPWSQSLSWDAARAGGRPSTWTPSGQAHSPAEKKICSLALPLCFGVGGGGLERKLNHLKCGQTYLHKRWRAGTTTVVCFVVEAL